MCSRKSQGYVIYQYMFLSIVLFCRISHLKLNNNGFIENNVINLKNSCGGDLRDSFVVYFLLLLFCIKGLNCFKSLKLCLNIK